MGLPPAIRERYAPFFKTGDGYTSTIVLANTTYDDASRGWKGLTLDVAVEIYDTGGALIYGPATVRLDKTTLHFIPIELDAEGWVKVEVAGGFYENPDDPVSDPWAWFGSVGSLMAAVHVEREENGIFLIEPFYPAGR